jgi:2-C-methyl-D-erythritol 4-phosphate cytidylyltransferase
MEEHIEVEGRILTVLAGTMFRVELDNKHQVLATISGKMRKRFVRLTIGDRVKMQMSQYDLNKARIVWRWADRRERQDLFEKLAAECHFQKPFRIVAGGAERQDSVWNGLEALSGASEIVAIQDAARPCTNGDLIAATVQAAVETGAAVAAQPVTDTLKESADGRFIQRTLDRSRLWSVQTPQTFRVDVIRRALAEVRRRGLIFTDDTAACELIGQPVRLVSSVAPNPKVTVPGDVPFVEMLLQKKI